MGNLICATRPSYVCKPQENSIFSNGQRLGGSHTDFFSNGIPKDFDGVCLTDGQLCRSILEVSRRKNTSGLFVTLNRVGRTIKFGRKRKKASLQSIIDCRVHVPQAQPAKVSFFLTE